MNQQSKLAIAADEYSRKIGYGTEDLDNHFSWQQMNEAFIAGAKWQESQMIPLLDEALHIAETYVHTTKAKEAIAEIKNELNDKK